MSDPRLLDREIRATFERHAPAAAPTRLLQGFESRARGTRRYPRWLALIKEPIMRTESRITVGSPTTRVAAVALASILLAAMATSAAMAATQLLSGPATITVRQDGTGDASTIAEALKDARDGTTIVIYPGEYHESLRVASDVTLRSSEPGAVTLIAADDSPLVPVGEIGLVESQSPYALYLVDSDGKVDGLGFTGADSAVIVSGGAPSLMNLRFDGVEPTGPDGASGSALVISGGSTATVSGATLLDSGPISVSDRSEPDIDTNVLAGGSSIYGAFGDEAVVRGNRIEGAKSHGIRVMEPTTMRIEQNHILGAPSVGIYVGWGQSEGFDPEIVDNVIVGSRNGINIEGGASPRVVGNDVSEARTAIHVRRGSPVIMGNHVHANEDGILVQFGQPQVEGNSLEGNVWPLVLGGAAEAFVSDNHFCENVNEVATYLPDVLAANDVCQ